MSAVPHTGETAPGITVATGDADETRALGARLARLLRAGDLVMLSGGLGAGKTTLAQGIGAALQVRGRVSSPTFIIARVHPALSDGPDLIHVDAYRITSLEEIDALDLDSAALVLDWLRRLTEQGTTVVMVTHDVEAAARADAVAVMSQGHLVQWTGCRDARQIAELVHSARAARAA